MELQEYISFLEKLDQRIVWIDHVPFVEYRPYFYWSLPKFVPYRLDVRKARQLLFSKALGVIWPDDRGEHSTKFCMCDQSDYDMKHLQSRTRTKVRRGLENCEIRRVSWENMRLEGLAINIEALKRQGRRSGRLDNVQWWNRQCRISAGFSDVLAYGVFARNEFAGYVHVIIHDHESQNKKFFRTANIAHFMSGSKHLKRFPNEALIFTVTQKLFNDYACTRVILGSTSNDPDLLAWKRHMGYKELPVACFIIANPILHLVKHFIPKLKNYLNRQ